MGRFGAHLNFQPEASALLITPSTWLYHKLLFKFILCIVQWLYITEVLNYFTKILFIIKSVNKNSIIAFPFYEAICKWATRFNLVKAQWASGLRRRHSWISDLLPPVHQPPGPHRKYGVRVLLEQITFCCEKLAFGILFMNL